MPRAVIVVDLYGQSADYDRIGPICEEYGIPLIEDAAEALGAIYKGKPVGPVWKPMHLQPVFKDCTVRGGLVSEELFEEGLCLPSGSAMSREQVERVCSIVRRSCPSGAKR